ncbi:hypothetical protein XENOCAPTIV_023371 [Xenoophorus captivus]|uniref:Uncharacterized protein n=1 Tax=Xenoophorus captivus TaxID=1517983 RepID=A0ABV0QJQ2_9TELE
MRMGGETAAVRSYYSTGNFSFFLRKWRLVREVWELSLLYKAMTTPADPTGTRVSARILNLSGRKLREYPGINYDLTDTTQAGESLFGEKEAADENQSGGRFVNAACSHCAWISAHFLIPG